MFGQTNATCYTCGVVFKADTGKTVPFTNCNLYHENDTERRTYCSAHAPVFDYAVEQFSKGWKFYRNNVEVDQYDGGERLDPVPHDWQPCDHNHTGAIMGKHATEADLPKEVRDHLRKHFGLEDDQPLPMFKMVKVDLGKDNLPEADAPAPSRKRVRKPVSKKK